MNPNDPRGPPPYPQPQQYGRPWEPQPGYNPTSGPPPLGAHQESGSYLYGPPHHPPTNMSYSNPHPPHFMQPMAWPSSLANSSMYPPQQGTPQQPPSRPRPSGPAQGSTPRKTLTDEDRKAMCIYHQENPHLKQTDIGTKFGVERSTVSKVLRQKDKYLSTDDGKRSPVKKVRGKFPDLEKGLDSWAKRCQQNGETITDAMIKEKVDSFTRSLTVPEGVEKLRTSAWLRKFKSKHKIGYKRDYDEAVGEDEDESAEMQDDNDSSEARGSTQLSPDSFASNPFQHKPPGTIPMPSAFGESSPYYPPSNSPYSAHYSPDPQSTPNPFASSTPPFNRLPPIAGQLAGQQQLPGRRPSQGFPSSLTSEMAHHPPSQGMGPPPLTPQYGLGIEGSQQQGGGSRARSSVIMTDAPPVTEGPLRVGSPTQDEAKRGMETVMAFIQHQPPGTVVSGENEYQALQKVMSRLNVGSGSE